MAHDKRTKVRITAGDDMGDSACVGRAEHPIKFGPQAAARPGTDHWPGFAQAGGLGDAPEWSRALHLLLDYAICEGGRRGLHAFVYHLRLADMALANTVKPVETAPRKVKSH